MTLFSGDIVSVHAFGQMTVVVNTIEAAKEMFQRRSTIYSDRPQMPMSSSSDRDLPSGMRVAAAYPGSREQLARAPGCRYGPVGGRVFRRREEAVGWRERAA